MRAIRTLLMIQIALFAFAALTHFGVLMSGHRHRAASIAETVIGAILLAGLLSTLIRPAFTRGIAITVQTFALLGTGVGIATIVAGFGPQSALDLVFHAAMATALIAGLIVSAKAQRPGITGGAAVTAR